MFIVNQDGDLCVEVQKVGYVIEYSDKVKIKLDEIYKRRMNNRYYHGSTENCEREIKREQEYYIRDNKIEKEFQIYVNGTRFAIFENHDNGIIMFKFIIESLSNGAKLVNLSKTNSVQFKKDKKYNIITLCGSTKFKPEFIKEEKRLTLEDNIVFSPIVFNHYDNIKLDDSYVKKFSDSCRKKIDISDEVFVINKGGYIGESTKSEIIYAESLGKKITYMEPVN